MSLKLSDTRVYEPPILTPRPDKQISSPLATKDWMGFASNSVYPQPSTRNPTPSTFNPHPSTLTPQPSTLNRLSSVKHIDRLVTGIGHPLDTNPLNVNDRGFSHRKAGVCDARTLRLRFIASCITQLKARGPSRTCNDSKEEEEQEEQEELSDRLDGEGPLTNGGNTSQQFEQRIHPLSLPHSGCPSEAGLFSS